MEQLSTKEMPESWVRPYYPSLNGIRGLAILAVFVCHYGPFLTNSEAVAWSWTGVDLFFVLSGFLITGILFDSIQSRTFYRSFYTRRALRIFPAYYGLILFIYLATWLSHSVQVKKTFALNLFYLSNLTVPFLNWKTHNPTTIQFLYYPTRTTLEATVGIFWSLCVEEHFYLLWPLIVRWLGSRKRLMNFCVKAILFTIVLRIVLLRFCSPLLLTHHLLYQSTYTRWDELLMGAWGALWLREAKISRPRLRRLAYGAMISTSLLLGCGVTLMKGGDFNHITNPFVSTIGFSLTGLFAGGVLLLSLDPKHAFSRLLLWSPLQSIGKVSYGFYLFHMLPLPIFVLLLNRGLRQQHLALVALIVVSLLVYGAAWVSYRFFESPLIRLKSRV